MIVRPRIKGFVCITSHPSGCLENVRDQIKFSKERQVSIENRPRRALIIGSSTGYGLASRVACSFSAGSETLGVYFERAPKEGKLGSPGFYNTLAFDKFAREAGIKSIGVNGDAFSDECKQEVVSKAHEMGGDFDLVIYSLASPRRTDPLSGETHRACLKPIGAVYRNKTLDTDKELVKEITIEPASPEEIASTEKVMGGEDWQLWTELLLSENLLSRNCVNLAYSYIGPDVTRPIYRNGTIGKAKEHLEISAERINKLMTESIEGRAFVSVNKAVVTQASSAIPVVPLYMSILFKVMREKGTHEGCIEQICRLFQDRIYAPDRDVLLDQANRIRLDDWEMEQSIQDRVIELWPQVTSENLGELTDFKLYQEEFLKLFGFGHPRVDYELDVDPMAGL